MIARTGFIVMAVTGSGSVDELFRPTDNIDSVLQQGFRQWTAWSQVKVKGTHRMALP